MSGTGAAGASYGDLLVTSLVVLGGVCVVAFVVVRLAGRLLATGRTRGAHLLDVVARLPLEPRRSLYVVEVAGKTLLVGTSEMGLSVLSELDGDEVRMRRIERPSFGELVRSAWQRRRASSPPNELDAAHSGCAASLHPDEPGPVTVTRSSMKPDALLARDAYRPAAHDRGEPLHPGERGDPVTACGPVMPVEAGEPVPTGAPVTPVEPVTTCGPVEAGEPVPPGEPVTLGAPVKPGEAVTLGAPVKPGEAVSPAEPAIDAEQRLVEVR